jgi:hypothetical protein
MESDDPQRHSAESNIETLRPFLSSELLLSGVSWGDLNRYMSRLDSITPGGIAISPPERIDVGFAACTTSINALTKQYGIHHKVVQRSARDLAASIIYGNYDMEHFVPGDVASRIQDLTSIEAKLGVARKVREHPVMQYKLLAFPHVAAVLDAYLEYGSAKYLLSKAGVGYNSYQLRSVSRFLLADNVLQSIDGIWPVARKYLFGRWLNSSDPYEIDTSISKTAAFILASEPSKLRGRDPDRIRAMKTFLIEILKQEDFAAFGTTGLVSLAQFKNRLATDADFVYKRMAQFNVTPRTLKNYARQVIFNTPQEKRSARLKPDNSQDWRNNLDWAGTKFLETALILEMNSERPNLTAFTRDVNEGLKLAKAAALKDSEINTLLTAR